MQRPIRILIAAIVALSLVAGPASADHEDGYYEIPADDIWTKTKLVVWVVPPNHGQLYNGNGAMNDGDPDEATPFNSYLRAVEDSIEEWDRGIRRFGSRRLRRRFEAKVYVLGRDDPVGQSASRPDIVVTTDENKGPILGFALYTDPCIVNNSKMMTRSFTYADMFNVNAQEYGHCLGLGHVGSQGGADPTSSQKHPEHDVMNGFYADPVGEAGTHLHCVSTLDVAALEYVFADPTGSGRDFLVTMPVEDYRTTCGGSGRPSPEDAP